MSEEKSRLKKHFFIDWPIGATTIADMIARHSSKTNIGAHDVFLGQVRADVIDGQTVKAIEYSAYKEMAENELEQIRENVIVKYNLSCAHVLHSIGAVGAGEICLFVLTSSVHRKEAFDACREMVELIKKEVPIFGKEIFEDGTDVWKENVD